MDQYKSPKKFDMKMFQRMFFVYNCLENGWTIRKKDKFYVFRKKHENKEEYFDDNYIYTFMNENLNTKQLIGDIYKNTIDE